MGGWDKKMRMKIKNLIFILLIVSILVAVSGCTNNSNNTTNNSTNASSNVVVNNSTDQNTTHYISSAKALEVAKEYTAMGVTLGTPTLTTLNGVKVWKVPVKTVGTDENVDDIYINAQTGKKVQ